MPRIDSDTFIYEEDQFETGHDFGVLRLAGLSGCLTLYFQAKDKLPQLQQLRDLCQDHINALAAKQAQEASIRAVLAQASPEEQKDDPDLVPVLVPLVDEIPF